MDKVLVDRNRLEFVVRTLRSGCSKDAAHAIASDLEAALVAPPVPVDDESLAVELRNAYLLSGGAAPEKKLAFSRGQWLAVARRVREILAGRAMPAVDPAALIRDAKREVLSELRKTCLAIADSGIIRAIDLLFSALDPKCEHKRRKLEYFNGAEVWQWTCFDCQAVAPAIPGEWKEAANEKA